MNWLKTKIKEGLVFLWELIVGICIFSAIVIYGSIWRISLGIFLLGGYILYFLGVVLSYPSMADGGIYPAIKMVCLVFPPIAIPWGWINFLFNHETGFNGRLWAALF